MTISPPSVRVGAQRPRLLSVPPRRSTAGQEAVDLAASAGLVLDDWQRFVLLEALGERPDGRWAAFEVALICPRQSGKGSILEALELAALFLPDPDAPPPLILHSAHEFKTSAEHFRRMRDLIERSPQLSARVRIIRTAAGSEAIELHSGARLRFVTRTGGSGRGFSADLIVIDEAYNLTAEAMAAVLPTMSARPNPQVWYTSSAGMVSSDQLERVRERGIKGDDPSLAFFEWSAPEDADLDAWETWAVANPALNIRVPEHFVAAERAALPDEQFARERCGIWPEKDRRATAFDMVLWDGLQDRSAERGSNPVFAVATAPDRTWSAIVACWHRPDGQWQVMLTDYHAGASWVTARCEELEARWGGRFVANTAARGLITGADEPSEQAQAQAHNSLSDRIGDGTVHHYAEPALNVAVAQSKWRAYGNTRVLDRRGSADITPAEAAALALHALGELPPADFFTI